MPPYQNAVWVSVENICSYSFGWSEALVIIMDQSAVAYRREYMLVFPPGCQRQAAASLSHVPGI
jgi:hypothetical protein